MGHVEDAGAAVQRARPALVPGRHPQPGARPAAPTAHRPSGEGRSPAQPGTRGGLEAAGAPGGPAPRSRLACRHLPLPRPHPTCFPHHKPQTCTCGSLGQARAREAAGTGSRGHSEQPKLVLKQKPAEAGVSPPTWNCGWQRPTDRAQPPALRTLQSLGSLGPQDPASRPGRCTERPPRPLAPTALPCWRQSSRAPDAPHSCPSETRIPFTGLPSGIPSSFLPSCTPKQQRPQDRLQDGRNPPASEQRKRRRVRSSYVPSGPGTQAGRSLASGGRE